MTQNCTNSLLISSLKNSPRFMQSLNPSRNIKMWVPLCACSLSLNLTENIHVQFLLVSVFLFSSVWNSSLIMVLMFMHTSLKFMKFLACLHSHQQTSHAWVSVSMDLLKMWLLYFPSMISRPFLMLKQKPENTSRKSLQPFTPLYFW